MSKWKEVFGGLFLISLLTSCSVSNEDRAIGTWQVVYDGVKLDSFLVISDDQTVTIDEGDVPMRSGTEEYRIVDTAEDAFTLEIADPSNDSYHPIFEGYFDDQDTIVMGSESDGDQGDVLIRVESLDEARAELEQE
ncbi:hypothetical protein NSQ54_17110 [Alkalihalobacillus sp. FSL W8-0930]